MKKLDVVNNQLIIVEDKPVMRTLEDLQNNLGNLAYKIEEQDEQTNVTEILNQIREMEQQLTELIQNIRG